MPWPVRLEQGPGRLVMPVEISITADAAFRKIVPVLIERLAAVAAVPVKLDEKASVISLERTAGEAEEQYTLSVTPQRCVVRASTQTGLLRGFETLLQLLTRRDEELSLPVLEIEDAPRYSWRGVLIDPARHFLPPQVVKRLLDCMPAMKLNVLHWHLSDDQGFRMESRRFPRLHQRGSEGQYYTQEQVPELITYASDRGVRVVPEFDIPGHTTSWVAGYPFLGSAPGDETAGEDDRYQLRRRWGVSNVALDPTREEVFDFLEKFIEEMCGLFPDPCFHIGGDEVLPVAWTSNPRIVDWMAHHEMRHSRDLQVYFNQRLSGILKKCGKRMVGWDEILHEDLPGDAIVQSWRGQEFFADALERHDSILSSGYYLDQLLPASYHYVVDPEDNHELTADQKRRIAGGEGCLWGEYIGSENFDSRAWPRLCAVAERLWSPASVRDVPDMYQRLASASAHLQRLGSRHRQDHRELLQRLLADAFPAMEALETLAAVVEPVKFYDRALARLDSSHTPLNRLVDAVQPESDTARRFAEAVAAFLSGGSEGDRIRELLAKWRDHRVALEPAIRSSPLLAEVEPISRNLAGAAERGLAALDLMERREPPTERWWLSSVSLIERAKAPRAELVLVVLPAIRQLIDRAAGRD